MILQCGNKDCRKWQHVKCIAETAVQQAGKFLSRQLNRYNSNTSLADEATGNKNKTTRKETPKNISIDKNSSALAKAESGSFTAEVFIKGLPDAENRAASEVSEIAVTNKGNNEKHTANVCCLFCEKEIE